MASILVVDDEPGVRDFLVETLESDGHQISSASNGTAALEKLHNDSFDLVITDLRMPGGVDGTDVVRETRRSSPGTKVIVLTAYGSVSTAVDMMKLGAHDFLEKPVSGPTELRILVSRALASDAAGSAGSSREQLAGALGADYTVGEEIGSGGYATVLSVHDTRLDRELAAKVLLPEFAASAEVADRFRQEARTMARLAHSNIMPVLFVGRELDVPFFVMPRIMGGSVEQLIAAGPLTRARAMSIARDVASALDYAHASGVIHRDVKPENVLIDPRSQRAILADFGIAKAVALRSASSTAPGMFLGTPRYASPEQISGDRELSARSDLYSFAAMTYEMLSGHVPFDGGNVSQLLVQHLTAPVPSLQQYDSSLPLALDAVMRRAMAKEPADRFPSVKLFMTALEDAMKGSL